MGIIFAASSLPGSIAGSSTTAGIFLRKTTHFVIFGILGLLVLRALQAWMTPAFGMPALLAISVAIAVGYAASDEYHQTFTPGRHGSANDVAIDAAGAACFLAAAAVRKQKGTQANKGVCTHG